MIMLPVEEAVGKILAHDMTRIIPGEFKGPAFKKGHILRPEDIPMLRSMGKNHVYIFEMNDSLYHEDEAAAILAALLSGTHLECTAPSEGRINLMATIDGVLKIDREVLHRVNTLSDIIVSTCHSYTPVQAGQVVAGTRIIPLTIMKEKMAEAEAILHKSGPIINLFPYRPLKIGIVVTGSEVFNGIIEDRFGPVLAGKVETYGGRLQGIVHAPDDAEAIAACIRKLVSEGSEAIMVSGGMSVDPDDVTPKAIEMIADRVVTYGAPVLPGAMFMLAYSGPVPVMGVPGCGMYRKITILDIILPRIMTGMEIKREDITELGHGGLCLGCNTCTYPICPFGKG